jgi:hypothetical protein
MTSTSYRVRTANGWVGRRNLSDALTDTMPESFAYCYDDVGEAIELADRFGGAVVGPNVIDNRPTLTVGQLVAVLAGLPPDRPVIVGTDTWYRNIDGVTIGDPAEAVAVVLETRDDFDSRQW